ncbi:hypothetical protein HAX54_016424 [Datura stramonium]|uniref:Ribosomal RNA small subunit methyltransferase NEP1 n=1 Tax=Datura stramonium TaxID=4076 RepID=A0ABS8UIT6_DATST|nr:hypothetical protein [Datura stramonium]
MVDSQNGVMNNCAECRTGIAFYRFRPFYLSAKDFVRLDKTVGEITASWKTVDLLDGIPVVSTDQSTKHGVIFIIERASLEIAKIGKTYQLLNSDEHSNFLKKNNRNPSDYRPDIAHQAMLTIPEQRLLQKLSITALGKREKLLRVIKNPVSQYLTAPEDSSEKLVDIQDYVNGISNDMNLVFVVGAMAHGKIDKDYVEDYLSISDYPLSAAYCISMITNAVERKWKIL